MRVMKDSGVEWIGTIPALWDTMKIKHSATIAGRIGWQGLTSEEYCDEGAFLITGINFRNGQIDWNSCVHVPMHRWEEASQIQINDGDLLITKDGTVGKVAIVSNMPAETSLNSGVLLIRPNNCNTKYLYWILQSDIFWKWFSLVNAGNSTIVHLYQNDFLNFSFPLPDKETQYRISCFLDAKCAKIDAIIAKQQEIIEKLKTYKLSIITEAVTKGLNPDVPMKDSGNEWIGKIPQHWKLGKLRYFSERIGDGLHGTPMFEDGDFYFINGNNLGNKHIEIKRDTKTVTAEEASKYSLPLNENTLLISLNGTIGNISVYNGEQIVLGKSAGYIIVADTYDKDYLRYYLQSQSTKIIFELSFAGTTIHNLSLETLRSLPIFVMSKDEQKSIAEYLDRQMVRIESLIEQKALTVTKLTEYKKSLIYEAVTGKWEV